MSSTPVERLTAELNKQFRSFLNRMDKLRKPLDFARDHYYLTQECEPVLELLKPGIAWVAQGRYGPTLISRNLPIWDADIWAGDKDGDILDRLHRVLDSTPEAECRSFRVYATFNGIRVIATEEAPPAGSLSPFEADWFKAIGKAINADPAYMAISSRQKCSRARLKPKPDRYEATLRLAELHDRGLTRACRFVGSIGTPKDLAALQAQIAFHDAETEALDSDKELF